MGFSSLVICSYYWSIDIYHATTMLKIILMKRIILTLLLLCIFSTLAVDLWSQCPMCRLSAESNLNEGGTEGLGLNKGILYMLTLPYLCIFTLGFLWYRNKKANVE